MEAELEERLLAMTKLMLKKCVNAWKDHNRMCFTDTELSQLALDVGELRHHLMQPASSGSAAARVLDTTRILRAVLAWTSAGVGKAHAGRMFHELGLATKEGEGIQTKFFICDEALDLIDVLQRWRLR